MPLSTLSRHGIIRLATKRDNGIPLYSDHSPGSYPPSAYRDLASILTSRNNKAGTLGKSGGKTIPLPYQHKRHVCISVSPVDSLHAQKLISDLNIQGPVPSNQKIVCPYDYSLPSRSIPEHHPRLHFHISSFRERIMR